MKRRGLLSAVGVLTAGAGCLRLSEAGSGPTTPDGDESDQGAADPRSETATGTATGTEPPADAPPGLQGDTVKPFLADAHQNALSRTTFTTTFRGVNLTRGETMEAFEVTVGEEGALQQTIDGSGVGMFLTHDGAYWRQEVGGEPTYGKDRRRLDLEELSRARRLRNMILAGDWDAPELNDDGQSWSISAEGVDTPAALKEEYEAAEVTSFSGEGVVQESGVVSRFTVEFEFVHEEEDRLMLWTVDLRTTDVGSTDTAKPEWLETAVERAPQVTARITDDGRFVEMEHGGGNAILPETDVVLYERRTGDGGDGRGNWGYRQLDRRIEAGTTMYLWMDGDRFRWQEDSKPADVNAVPLDGLYGFWMHRNGAEYFGNIELPR
ncbi:hypothetical protein [Haloarchaeobius sp. TZWWS8]|uniref:hypothetical protein n=1 Tax=Haloarchaeobius sp. TZWWS8 TaxID=3446121 RepID=UPI003EC048F2